MPRQQGGNRFKIFWGNFTGNLKRLSLFLLTVSYMPVARAILENFSGQYDEAALQRTGYVVIALARAQPNDTRHDH